MSTYRFIELKSGSTLLLRERTLKQFQRSVKTLNLRAIVNHPNTKVLDVVTTMQKPVGNIFECSL